MHRFRREIAAMAAALHGLDVVVFTGGIAEHQLTICCAAADGLGFLGLAVDPIRNATATGDSDITATGSAVRALVVTSCEDLEIAREVRQTLA